jgi:hypothetical protein
MKRIVALIFIAIFFLIGNIRPISAEALSVTASVPPEQNDLVISADSSLDESTVLHEDDVITITIHYHSLINAGNHLVIQGSWEKGLIDNSSFSYLDVFDYVVGSATSSDGVSHVVDLQNNTILWTIPHLTQSNIDSTLSFQLKVKDSFVTREQMSSVISIEGTIESDHFLSQDFHYNLKAIKESSSSPTNAPTSTQSQQGTAPIPSITTVPLRKISIDQISIQNITATSALIHFTTSQPSQYSILYGTSETHLTKQIMGKSEEKFHSVELSSLSPNTNYYFKIQIQNGINITTSDIFMLKTASQNNLAELSHENVRFTVDQYPITTDGINHIFLPNQFPFVIAIQFNHGESITDITGTFVNANVLGINTFNSDQIYQQTKFIQLFPNIFSARLVSPYLPGTYELNLTITDAYGGFSTLTVPYKIVVSHPIEIYDKEHNEPIENAQVIIQKYSSKEKKYTNLDNNIRYNNRTDEHGYISLALAPGSYMLHISAVGFKSKDIPMQLDAQGQNYPHIDLISSNSIVDRITSYADSFQNVQSFFMGQIKSFLASTIALKTVLGFTICMIFFLIIMLYSLIRFPHHTQPTKRIGWIRHIVFLSVINSLIIDTVIISCMFLLTLRSYMIPYMLVCTVIMVVLWIIFLNNQWKTSEKKK